jgi:hypothetical protein
VSRRPYPKKTFEVGEVVLFQRFPGARPELGEYMGPDRAVTGWHYVRDDTGWRERHYVPTVRLKKTAKKGVAPCPP